MMLVFLLYALFGFTFTLGKIILNYASPFFVVASRMVIAGLALTIFLHFKKGIRCVPARADRWLYFQYMFFGIFVFYCSRAWALQYLPAVKSALLFNLNPFFTAIFAYFFLQERLTFRKLCGLIIGFSGMLPILASRGSVDDIISGISFFSLPELVTIGSVASLSYSLVIMQQLVKHRGCSPLLVNGVSMLTGGALSLSAAYVTEPIWVFGNVWGFVGLLALQILISNIVCANLQATLLKKHSTVFMAFASFLSPLCAAFYGTLLLGETITWHFFASFSLVFLGLSVYYLDSLKEVEPIL